MKKIIFTLLIISTLLFSVSIFAQTATQDIMVQSLTGTVQYEVSPGNWEALTVDNKIAPSTVINTGLNSSLILKKGNQIIKIKAMQKGTIEKLSKAQSSIGGLKLGATATNSTVNSNSTKGRTNISTASTRASDAVGDLEWDEGEENKTE